MKTREKIILTALELFNTKGLKHVTVRTICDKMSISPGNFTYYFTNAALIVEELYNRMTEESYNMLETIDRQKASVTYFLDLHQVYFTIQIKYRFFYLNLFEILNNYPKIRTAYHQKHEAEKALAEVMLKEYIQKGVLIPSLNQLDIERIINLGYILNNFWILDAEIHHQTDINLLKVHYLNLCCGRLGPYLTPEAKQEFDDYFNALKT